MLSYFGYAIIFQNIFYFYPFYKLGPEEILNSPSIMAVIALSTMLALFLIFASLFAKGNHLLRKAGFFSISLFLNSIYLIFIGILLLIFNYTIFTSPFVDYTKGHSTLLYHIPLSITYLAGAFIILVFMSIAKALSGDDRSKKYDNYAIAFSLVFNTAILWTSFFISKGKGSALLSPLATATTLSALLAIYFVFRGYRQ